MAQCDSKSLQDFACASGFACLRPHDVALVITSLLCQILKKNNPMAQCDAKSLLESACQSGIACLGERELAVVIAQLACEILQSGGGGGSSCLLCGDVDPVAVPPCDCAMYYNKIAGSFWLWDKDLVKWFALLGA